METYRMSKHIRLFLITAVVLVGIFFIAADFYKSSQEENTNQIVANNQAALIRDHSPTKGSSMLKVTLVEFLDPECESCAFFHPLVKAMLKKFDGRIRYVVRYAPFHPNSKFAIKILTAARKQNKYWETLDLLYEKLPEWGSHQNPQPELIWTYLPSLNLDIEKLKVDMKDESILALIKQEVEDGNTFGVRQTPTFFINGQILKSFGPKQLEQALKFALEE